MQTSQERAFEAYDNREFEQAVTLLRQAVAESDAQEDREKLLLRLASAYDELGRYTDALEALKTVLDENESSAAAWNNIGVVCQRLNRLDDARMAFEKAYKLDPENADHLISLGSISLKLSDPGNALQYLKLAIELLPGHPVAHANLALTYAVFGRLEEAEDALRLAILYGFKEAEAIQQKIDALKLLRDQMVREQGRKAEAPGSGEEEAPPAGGEIELLVQLEQEMYALAAERYSESNDDAELHAPRMRELRQSIRTLRKTLGMDEQTDADVVRGVNIMAEEGGEQA